MFIMLLLHDACPCDKPPAHLYFLPPMEVRVVGLGQFLRNPLAGIADRVSPLSSKPCSGLMGRSCYGSFGPCSPFWGKTILKTLDGYVWPSSWTRDTLLVRGSPLSQEVSEVCQEVQFSSQLLICLTLNLLPWFFFGGEVPHCHALSFCCNLRPSIGWWSCSSRWEHEGLEQGDWCHLGWKRGLVTALTNSFPWNGSFSYLTGNVCCAVLPQGLDLWQDPRSTPGS